jgi:hypothetical protein
MDKFEKGVRLSLNVDKSEINRQCGLGWAYEDMMKGLVYLRPDMREGASLVEFRSREYPNGREVWVFDDMIRRICVFGKGDQDGHQDTDERNTLRL